MSKILLSAVLASLLPWTGASASPPEAPHNVILFVADGLRAGMVKADTAPTMYAIRESGVWFKNSHSLFPTFTTPNASALATGHYLGDTGDFGNTIYTGFALESAAASVTPFLENDAVLGEVDAHFAGSYLSEESLLHAAHARGYSTAAVGKLGPAAIQDVTARDCQASIVVDDSTGHAGGVPLCSEFAAALAEAGLAAEAPGRGANGAAGDFKTPGTLIANVVQQRYFTDVTTRVLLPRFKAAGKPFVIVFWSRDPDGSQHNQGDSLGRTEPGINGPTSLAGIRNADDNLAALLAALERLDLARTTDVLVTADHGFSTISKQSKTSPSAREHYADVAAGQLPPGFLAIDLAGALGMTLFDPDARLAEVNAKTGQHPSRGNALIGTSADKPALVIASNGGSDLIYLPRADAATLLPQVVHALLAQDYVSGVFTDDALGAVPGALPLSSIGLVGHALTPHPAIVVNFTSSAGHCAPVTNCAVEIADTGLQQGQGMHGSFSRADTYNFMAAMGPDFRTGYVDEAPASNADVGQTLFAVLHLATRPQGKLLGRSLTEALKGGRQPASSRAVLKGPPSPEGLATVLKYQTVGTTRYFDSAGFPGRTVGLDP